MPSKAMRVFFLSKRDAKAVLASISSQWGLTPIEAKPKEARRVVISEDKGLTMIIFREFCVVSNKGSLLPHLTETQLLERLPSVLVDKGAVKFLCSGANVMRPGILDFPKDFSKGQVIGVKESSHGKFIAVGRALMSKEEAVKAQRGAVIENLHYVGDAFWEALKEPL